MTNLHYHFITGCFFFGMTGVIFGLGYLFYLAPLQTITIIVLIPVIMGLLTALGWVINALFANPPRFPQ